MRRRLLYLLAILAIAAQLRPTITAEAQTSTVVRCIESAAAAHRLPAAVIVTLLQVEGGSLGRVSQNTNATVDIGPMQVNTIWVPMVARHWSASPADTYVALRDSFCANVEAGSWILRQAIDDAHGDFWDGVGFYHSHDPGYKADYLRKVLRQVLRLQSQVNRDTPSNMPHAAGS